MAPIGFHAAIMPEATIAPLPGYGRLVAKMQAALPPHERVLAVLSDMTEAMTSSPEQRRGIEGRSVRRAERLGIDPAARLEAPFIVLTDRRLLSMADPLLKPPEVRGEGPIDDSRAWCCETPGRMITPVWILALHPGGAWTEAVVQPKSLFVTAGSVRKPLDAIIERMAEQLTTLSKAELDFLSGS
jgi:hypothetical protein